MDVSGLSPPHEGFISDIEGGHSDDEFSGFGTDDVESVATRPRFRLGRSRTRIRARTRGRRSRPGRRPVPPPGREVRPRTAAPAADDESDDAAYEAPPHEAHEWNEDTTPPVHIPFTETPRMLVDVPTTILGFLQLFITRELLEFFVAETNSYAEYMRQDMLRGDRDPWTPVTLCEIARFVGMTMMMGFVFMPSTRMYWRRNKAYSMGNFASLMTRDRFEAIRRNFHSFNRKAIPRGNRDRLIQVRPLMEYLLGRFGSTYQPDCTVSLDEGLMPFKGRLNMKVYNPKKPHKYGVKLYMLCESKSGYVINFITYAGVSSSLRDIVFRLMEPYLHKGYHVYMDNFYNSVSLAEELYANGTHCSGTMRLARGAPPVLKNLAKQRVPRNTMAFRRKGNVFVICWMDIRLVTMVTTAHNADTEDFVHRRRATGGGQSSLEEAHLDRPQVISSYCDYMGGVDLFDQMMQYYNFARKSTKWTRKFLMFLLQMGIHNSFCLYRKFHPKGPRAHLLDFLDTCSEHLLYFDESKWPSSGGPPVRREADLPLAERQEHPLHPHVLPEDDPDDPLPDPAAVVAVPDAAVAVPGPSSSPPVSPPLPGPSTSSPTTSAAARSLLALASTPLFPPPLPSPSSSFSAAAAAPPSPPPPPSPPASDTTGDISLPPPAAPAPRRIPAAPANVLPPHLQPPQRFPKLDPACRLQPGHHKNVRMRDIPAFAQTKQKRCRVCSARGKRKDTNFMCVQCEIPLCGYMRDCFQVYHTEVRYWVVSGQEEPQAAPQE